MGRKKKVVTNFNSPPPHQVEVQNLAKKYQNPENFPGIITKTCTDEHFMRSEAVELKFNEYQKSVVHYWFDASTKMYNETVKQIYEVFKRYHRAERIYEKYKDSRSKEKLKICENNIKDCTNYFKFRKCYMKKKKTEILEEYNLIIGEISNVKTSKNTYIYSHMLNAAIEQCITAYKTSCTLFEKGYIHGFEFEKLSFDRPAGIIKLDSKYISNVESDFNKILGKIEAVRDGRPYNLQSVINDSILRYTAKGDKFTLYVPRRETIPSKVEKLNDFVSIDMGIRSPLTCLPSTDEQINFGEDLQKEIRNNLIWLETLKEKGYNKKFRRKWKKKLEAKIHNKVTNFHWQTCNILTKCVDKIVVGDLNVKSIISKENDMISDLDKKVLIKLRLRGFIQKLKYKCVSRNCSLTLVNEAYTSKVCSNCGNYKADLGGNKTYNCDNIDCGQSIDRDVNACINIFYKSSIKKYCRNFQD